jgi:competence protein ComEC
MQPYQTNIWKSFPFLRILLPLIAGIIIQFHFQLNNVIISTFSCLGLSLMLLMRFASSAKLYSYSWIRGVGLNLVFFSAGCLLTNYKDLSKSSNWVGRSYAETDAVVVTIQEPLVTKPKSYKALAKINELIKRDEAHKATGDMLIYFQKHSSKPDLKYGSQILITKPLQPISNSGNPGGFDYKRYCAFQGIYYQVFLKTGEYKVLQTTNANWFKQMLITTREWVLSVLRKNISGKNEVAVAEALLIGYRDDLDRELVQQYSNTGVVHIIAISGLHLGMIYWALKKLLGLLRKRKWNKFIQPILILFVLWMFTFIAGGVPSILRSAVMFTCIVIGDSLGRRTNIYNTLAASAFIMLLISPFYLWDVGFQLSFAAVLSIVAFSRHINNWFYFENKSLKYIWSMCAVTLSAQVLTIPIILYHFHQFPNLFLFTNMLIVPLSAIILFAELLLLIVAFIPLLPEYVGKAVEGLVWLMNWLIERTNRIPFALTDGIQISILQSVILYIALITGAVWLLRKNKQMMFASAASVVLFFGLRSFDLIRINNQQKLIVYNVPQHTAIDVVEGSNYKFVGDSSLQQDGFLRNFHLKPSRILNRMDEGILSALAIKDDVIASTNKKVIILDEPLPYEFPQQRIKIDAIIITKNPKLYINQLVKHYDCKMLIFDATNPLWKIRLWKKDCDSLHLPHHSVPEQGAFVMDL